MNKALALNSPTSPSSSKKSRCSPKLIQDRIFGDEFQKTLEKVAREHFSSRASDYYRQLGNTGVHPERVIVNLPAPPRGGLHRTFVRVNPESWQDRAHDRVRLIERSLGEFNHLEAREIGQIDRRNPRIYFDTDGPKNIMGLLKEFLELEFQFQNPLKFKQFLHLSPEILRNCQNPKFLEDVIAREIGQIMHRIERQSCPRFETELREQPRIDWRNLDDIAPVIPEERSLFRGELNSRLNINNLMVSVNPGTQNPANPPVPVAGINIQEKRQEAVSDQITVNFQPGTTYQITPAYTQSIYSGLYDNFQQYAGQPNDTATQVMMANPAQIYLNGNVVGTGYGNIDYGTSATTAYSNIAWGDNLTSTGATITFEGTATSAYGYFPPNAYVTVGDNGTFTISGGSILKVDPVDMVKRFIKGNLQSASRRKRTALIDAVPPNELKARDTLRDMISESDWRRYVTNGFIMTKAQSGRWYQIFNDRRHLAVYEKGVKIESICIHSDQKVPPTDHVINMKIMVELDEDAVRKGGNISRLATPNQPNPFAALIDQATKTATPIKPLTLVETFRTARTA